jgi:hypothetical protein
MPNRCARARTEGSERFNCIAISKGEPFASASSRNISSSSSVHRPPRLLVFISPSAQARPSGELPQTVLARPPAKRPIYQLLHQWLGEVSQRSPGGRRPSFSDGLEIFCLRKLISSYFEFTEKASRGEVLSFHPALTSIIERVKIHDRS